MSFIYIGYEEKWIWIKGNKTKYKICVDGKVLNTSNGKYMKGGKDKNGYHIVSLTFKKKKYTRKVHRLVAEAFIPNPNNLPEVNHKNGDKFDNCIDNLEWVSPHYNTYHAYQNELRKGKCLTIDNVKKICKLLEKVIVL